MKRIVALYIVIATTVIIAQSFGMLDGMTPAQEVRIAV